MQAILIDPVAKAISHIELKDGDDVKAIIGFDTVIADEINGSSDHLYFDEDCFIRGTEGRFQLDTLPPVAGRAVVLGAGPDADLAAPSLTIDELEGRIKFT